MALVGNGFDIQVLNSYQQTTTTRYADFYFFMKMKNVDRSNLLLAEMEIALTRGATDWSDIEACIGALEARGADLQDIRTSLDEVRRHFSEFLSSVVSPTVLARLSDDAQAKRWGLKSLSEFLGDISTRSDLRKIPFGQRKGNYDFYNFYFVNFNYTALLDNYLFMDSEQFDPVPYSTVDTNFTFHTDPRGFGKEDGDGWNFRSSSYVEMEVVHPHGYQDIPRSLLFGTNGDGDLRSRGAKLAKPYWARTDQRYGELFDQTSLFVVFGSSLGATDAWWWKRIRDALKTKPDIALLIYWWNSRSSSKATVDEVLTRFFEGADVAAGDRSSLSERICVVSYADDEDRTWLNMRR
ncbi:AbiH family protein [Curtobacterium flaccumfaciens]|uniref:AbiH family protein n=1 Tax=Curtobacterium flaccumfaciens TaxID=2035 RepID=UPI0038799E05